MNNTNETAKAKKNYCEDGSSTVIPKKLLRDALSHEFIWDDTPEGDEYRVKVSVREKFKQEMLTNHQKKMDNSSSKAKVNWRTLAEKSCSQICFTLVFASCVCFCFQLVSHGIYLAILANTLKHHFFKN